MKNVATRLGPMGEMVNNVLYQFTKIMPPIIPKEDFPSPKVSVVIPVYNTEKYLANIIRTIQHQTLKDLEIVFVDDGSTDNSLKIMKEFQKADKRIKVIENKKNRGILYSRMYGALQSKGEYIAFMDADDMYCNNHILKQSYETAIKDKLDLLQFEYFGGHYDGKDKFETTSMSTAVNKEKYNKILIQPEIRYNFYHIPMNEGLLSGIVYDKIYSNSLIHRMADAMGEECWNKHLIYMEDFIIVFTAARESKTFMTIPFAGSWHWYENPDGMTNKVFQMDGLNLKYPKETNKKLGDYLSIWERCFDITEDDPNGEFLRLTLVDLLAKPDNRHVFARTEHLERILVLCKRLVEWKYSSEKGREYGRIFGKNTILFTVSPEVKKNYISKYQIFYREDKDNE